ncbi:hypothetical protein LY78DRAFT_114739 [Colletotrichum sublineola]|nr:hypothetical protein LY78DRAFT_114739 [Colletotrichum sublineola]
MPVCGVNLVTIIRIHCITPRLCSSRLFLPLRHQPIPPCCSALLCSALTLTLTLTHPQSPFAALLQLPSSKSLPPSLPFSFALPRPPSQYLFPFCLPLRYYLPVPLQKLSSCPFVFPTFSSKTSTFCSLPQTSPHPPTTHSFTNKTCLHIDLS